MYNVCIYILCENVKNIWSRTSSLGVEHVLVREFPEVALKCGNASPGLTAAVLAQGRVVVTGIVVFQRIDQFLL